MVLMSKKSKKATPKTDEVDESSTGMKAEHKVMKKPSACLKCDDHEYHDVEDDVQDMETPKKVCKTTTTPKKPTKKSTTPKKPTKKSNKPFFGVERTRSQVMCRTGQKGPGTTYAIKWVPTQACKNEEEATAKAEEWVRKQMVKEGL